MGYIDETTKEGRTVERLIRFMKSVENPSWMVDLVENMRDKLAEYEDLEEQGRLLKLPCAVGDVVYTNASVQGWCFRKENRPYAAKVLFTGINGADNYINVDFGNGHMIQFKFSEIGKTVFLTKAEAEAALKELENKRG